MNTKTLSMHFASTNSSELWKLIDKWLEEEQKTGVIEVTSTACFNNSDLWTKGMQFTTILFYIKFPK